MNNPGREPLITKSELCKILNKTKVTLWRWQRDGLLPNPVVVDGKPIGWTRSSIDKWIGDSMVNPSQTPMTKKRNG